jgi:hypothetical protein
MLIRGPSPSAVACRTVAAALLAMIGLCGPLAAQDAPKSDPGAESPTLSRVFAAWQARQERIKSFYFAWNVRAVLPKGYEFPGVRVLPGLRAWDVVSDKHVEFSVPQSEWSGAGSDRWQSDFSEIVYNADDGWKETGRLRITHDGTLNSRLRVPSDSAASPTIAIWRKVPVKHPSNIGSSGDSLLLNLEFDLVPLRLAVRPLGPSSDWTPENSRVVSEDALVGGVHCVKLQMDKMNYSEQCWVDPKRDYCVVRWERGNGANKPLDLVIDCEQSVDHEWLPARWRWTLFDRPGAESASFAATVTRRAVNKTLPEKTFTADYPRGTRVYDASVELPIVESDDHSGMLPPDEARPLLAAIADAWLKRQSQARRFKYVWRREGDRNTINTLCVDGEKYMTEYKTPDWAPPAREAKPARLERQMWFVHEMKTVFDGVDTRDFRLSDAPQAPGGVVNIRPGSGVERTGAFPGDRYLFFVFRPLDPIFKGISVADLRDPAKFRIRRQTGKIGDVACIVIETEEHPGLQADYWLDPARDYLPLREHRTLNGEDRDRLDLSYRPDPTCGWVPVGWTDANVGMGGSVLFSNIDTVIAFTINQPIPAADFRLDTPPGADVRDARQDRRPKRERADDAAAVARMKALRAAIDAKEKAHPRAAKPVFDRFADPTADFETAFKLARDTNKRVLIVFGANWSVDCRVLAVALKENADLSAALRKGFVFVLVDIEKDAGRHLWEKYVPNRPRNTIPHLAVFDPGGKVLKTDDAKALEIDDDYSIPRVKAFLAEWSLPK